MRHVVGYAVSAFSGQQQLQGKSEGRDRPRTHCRVSGVTTTFKYESESSKLSICVHGTEFPLKMRCDDYGSSKRPCIIHFFLSCF